MQHLCLERKFGHQKRKTIQTSQKASGGFERKQFIFRSDERDQTPSRVVLEKIKMVATLLLAVLSVDTWSASMKTRGCVELKPLRG